MSVLNSQTTGSSVWTNIDSIIVGGAGWTRSGSGFPYTYTNPTAPGRDRDVSFIWNTVASNYMQFTAVGPGGNKTFYLWTGGASLSGNYPFFVAASGNSIFIVVEGPAASAGAGITEDTSYGSSRGFFGMFAMEPYFQTDTTKNNLVVAMSSNASASKVSNPSAYVARSRQGVSWQEARLQTVKPMIQGVPAAGVQSKKDAANNLQVQWPILVNEMADGMRGRLKDLYYGGETYGDTGDTLGVQYYEGSYANIDGNNHQVVYPFYLPNITPQYSPLGVPVKTTTQSGDSINGGPSVLVRI